MFKSIASKLALTGAVGIGLLGFAGAAPAFADGNPVGVNATATVSQSIVISGLTTAVDFGSINPGSTSTATGAEHFSVLSNDAAGYMLTETATKPAFTSSGAATIPDSSWSVTETGTGGHGTVINPTTTPSTVFQAATPGTTSFQEDWSLNVPATQQAGLYSNTLTYLAQGS